MRCTSTTAKAARVAITRWCPAKYVEKLVVSLPAGSYKMDWIDPASGLVVGTETFTHSGGDRTLTAPQHSVDIALRTKRVQWVASSIVH